MNTRRVYTMTKRMAAAEETRRRILAAAFALSGEKLNLEIVLEDVAQRAGVTVKTVLRHFGSREGLFQAVMEFAEAEIVSERSAPIGDIAGAVAVIFDHYERRGDWVLGLLSQESSDERVRIAVREGRGVHRTWVEASFMPQLNRVAPGRRSAVVDLLVLATDVYAWKVFRRDRELSRIEAEDRVRMLLEAVLNEDRERN